MIAARILGCLLALVVLAPGLALALPPTDNPQRLFESYLLALIHEQWDVADSLWVEEDRLHAHRLGVTFEDVPLKQDLDSPLWRWLEELRTGELRVGVERVLIDRERAELQLGFLDAVGPTRTHVSAEKTRDGWRLAAPLRHLRAGWSQHDGRYTRIFAPDLTSLASATLEHWDGEVERIARRLGMGDAGLRRLEEGRIDVLMAGEQEMIRMVGQATEGWADLDSESVVTQQRSHPHELTHVLVNVAAQRLPLYVLPLLQEGLAVHLGGRWGKGPAVMEMLGVFLLEQGMLEVDAIVDRGGFRTVSPDLSYAVAGLFCGYLLETVGPEIFLDVYRNGAGRNAELAAWTRDEARERVAGPTGRSWDELIEGFETWWPQRRDTGVRPAEAFDGELIWADPELGVEVRSTERTWVIRGPRNASVLRIAIRTEHELEGSSSFRIDHCPEDLHAQAALVLGENEAGLYDFVTDRVMAKWVRDFGGGGEPVDGEQIRFEIDRALLPVGARVGSVQLDD